MPKPYQPAPNRSNPNCRGCKMRIAAGTPSVGTKRRRPLPCPLPVRRGEGGRRPGEGISDAYLSWRVIKLQDRRATQRLPGLAHPAVSAYPSCMWILRLFSPRTFCRPLLRVTLLLAPVLLASQLAASAQTNRAASQRQRHQSSPSAALHPHREPRHQHRPVADRRPQIRPRPANPARPSGSPARRTSANPNIIRPSKNISTPRPSCSLKASTPTPIRAASPSPASRPPKPVRPRRRPPRTIPPTRRIPCKPPSPNPSASSSSWTPSTMTAPIS